MFDNFYFLEKMNEFKKAELEKKSQEAWKWNESEIPRMNIKFKNLMSKIQILNNKSQECCFVGA